MRQLAAIMFADMTGYTAMMQENEQLAREKRKRMKEVLENSVSKHNGKVLNYYGDGALSIFQSAIDSVHCGVEIQQLFTQEPRVSARIGLHLGDISVEDGDVFGDGVNIASRVETLAVPGSVFISEKIYEEVKNQENIQVKEMGYFELKNVKQPVRIFAIDKSGLVLPSRKELEGKTTQPVNRLAVLPFVNMSADPENEYFSDGITEELLNALTKVNGLQVISRTSAFAFKGKTEDIREIATKLNVDKVLEGSVRKSGNRVRITAQLINAADGYHIWSENYDRDLTDIFILQDEISSIIANRLRENLAAIEHKVKLVQAPTSNLDAYMLYLKGIHFSNKLTPADARKAIECFEEATILEPGYAHPFASLAMSYTYLGATGQMTTEKAFELAHKYSSKALQLDSKLSLGYVARGAVYMFHDWRWKDGYNSVKKAIELNPAGTYAHQFLYYYHTITGNKDEALKVMEAAYSIDPLSPVVNHFLAEAYKEAERYDAALRIVDHVLEMYPAMRASLELKGWIYGWQNMWDKALEIFLEVHKQTGHPLKGLTGLAYAYGKLGEKEKGLDCIKKMQQREREVPDSIMDADLAIAFWGIGEKQKSIQYMKNCIDKKLSSVAFFLDSKLFEGLKDFPEYEIFKKKLNLEKYVN